MRKRFWVIAVVVLLVVGVGGALVTHEMSDELSPLAAIASSDKTEYISVAQLTKQFQESGISTPPTHDMMFRTLEIPSGDKAKITQIVDSICKRRHWRQRHSDDFVLHYSSALGSSMLGSSTMTVYWKMPDGHGNPHIMLYESRQLSLWDEFVIRCKHGFRMPYSEHPGG